MNQMQILQAIFDSDPRGDWDRTSRGGTSVCFYRGDVNLRFESTLDEDDHHEFNEKWACAHPDPKAWRNAYYLYYAQTLLDSFTLVSVDGGRAQMPLPHQAAQCFDRFDYKVAEIFDTTGELERYVRSCGFADFKREAMSF